MFSKELENLIQATLEDGKLEENEKAALVKRAQREGVDLDELDIYINSLLQKRQRELNEKKEAIYEKYEEKKKEAIGPVCPKCGKRVPPLTLVCDCGFEFTKSKKISSVQELSDKISGIMNEPIKYSKVDGKEPEGFDRTNQKDEIMKERCQRVVTLISMFPVPNTKEDIIEFLAVSISMANKKIGFLEQRKYFILLVLIGGIITAGLGWLIGFFAYENNPFREESLKNAWRAKSEQVLIKGRSLRGDPEFTQQLDYYENMLKKK